MKIWMSSETSYTALNEQQCNLLREARNFVETALSKKISEVTYQIPLDSWDCIVVMMGDDAFEERVNFSVKKRNMDFRLKIDHAAFNSAVNDAGRQSLIFKMLMRSLDLLEEKFNKVRPKLEGFVFDELRRLRNDALLVAAENGW